MPSGASLPGALDPTHRSGISTGQPPEGFVLYKSALVLWMGRSVRSIGVLPGRAVSLLFLFRNYLCHSLSFGEV